MHFTPNDSAATALPPSDSATDAGFAALGLDAALLKALAVIGYREPTPVQAQTIPAALAGGDWLVSSQTGSGKTAAFLLPALHALGAGAAPSAPAAAAPRRGRSRPRILVLCPTRELAQQVAREAILLVRFLKGVRIASVVGGVAFAKQLMDLRGATVVVATPGRLLDLARNGQIDLEAVQTLVVDEADRMLDLGFSEDLAAIHAATAQRERTLMFSATFAPRIMALAAEVTRSAQRIELATAQDRHEHIEQRLHWYDDLDHKNALLEHYLNDDTLDQALVFTATQVETDELADELREAGYEAAGLHGAMSQAVRNRRLQALRDGRIRVLIATDVAARGIDVPTISHVINYGLPLKPEDYVHRIGRTGRAGRSGLAVTLAGARDRYRIRAIERFTEQPLAAAVIPGHEPRRRPAPVFDRGGRDDMRHSPREHHDRFDRHPRHERESRYGAAPHAGGERAMGFAREASSARGYRERGGATFSAASEGRARAPRAWQQGAPEAGAPAREGRPREAARGPWAHEARSERRGQRAPGPAQTEPALGGNRAARRAGKQAEYAARMAREGGNA